MSIIKIILGVIHFIFSVCLAYMTTKTEKENKATYTGVNVIFLLTSAILIFDL